MLEDIKLHKEAFKTFFYTIKKKQDIYKFLFQIFLISILDMISLGILFPYLQFVGNETNSFANLSFLFASNIYKVTFFCSLLILVAFILRFNLTKKIVSFAYTQEKHLSDYVITSVLNFPLETFSKLKESNIYRLVSTEIPQAVNAYFVGLVYMISGSLSALLIIVLMIAVHPFMALVGSFIFACFYLIIYLTVSKKINKLGIVRLELNEQKFNMFGASLSSYKDIRIARTRSKIISDYMEISSGYAAAHSNIQFATISPRYIVEFMLSIIIIALSFIYANGLNGKVNLADLMFFIAAGSRLLPILQIIYARLASVKYSLPTVLNVKKYLDEFMKYNQLISLRSINHDTKLKQLKKIDSIEIVNLNFKYKNDISNINFLDHIFAKGFVNLIIGKSGSGKTTLLNIIAGLLDVNSGTIKINNQSIQLYENNDWFSRISYVDQFPFLFEGTIKENIFIKNANTSKKDFRSIAEIVGLNKTLNEDSYVSEGGKNLSGGQRQKIAIARAILSEKDIFIFDEITSGIDVYSKKSIANAIENLAKEKLVICVSHDKYFQNKFPKNIYSINEGDS